MRDVVPFHYERLYLSPIPGARTTADHRRILLFFTLSYFYGTNSDLDCTLPELSHRRNYSSTLGKLPGGKGIETAASGFAPSYPSKKKKFYKDNQDLSAPGLRISKGPVPRSSHSAIIISTAPHHQPEEVIASPTAQ